MMQSTVPSSRDRLLDAAESLFRERGLAGTAIKDIVDRSGAPIGSVYHHFPAGKTELAEVALRRHTEKARRLLDEAFAGDAPVAARVRAMFAMAAKGFELAGRFKGCAIGGVTLDLGAGDLALRAACAEAVEGWTETIAAHLPWKNRKTRRSFAESVVTAFEGAFVVSRASNSGNPFLTAGEWLAVAADSYSERTR